MPRRTNFVLSQEQEGRLVTYLNEKIPSVQTDNSDRIRIDTEAWERYWLDVERRKGIAESIYPLSNIPVPTYAMIVEHFVSRIEEATSGDEPYWHFEAVGNEDEQKATTYSDYFEWKLKQGGVHTAMLDSQLPTVIQSACVQKATYTRNEISWIDMETRVLHDKTTGNPVETISDGPVIEGEDQWVDMPDPIGVLGQIGNAIGGAMGMEPSQPKMRKHLAADPSIVFDPNQHEWRIPPGGVKRSQVIYSGAKSEHVRYDRIFCAMDAASFEDSDVMELQDRTLDWFRANWLDRPWAPWSQYETQIKTGDSTPKVGQVDTGLGIGQPATARKVENRTYDHVNPVRRVAEFWVERDVLGNGTMPPQRFVVWFDIDLKVCVNYEWQAKVCPDLKRPYTVTTLAKQPNRWCGKSIWQRGKPLFDGVDRLFNGVFYRTLQQANPPKGGDPSAAREEPTDIAYDPTKYYELNKDRTIDDLISYAKVPDTNQRSGQTLDFLIFWIQLWLGVSNIAQGDYADVPANGTAQGIVKTLQEASLLGRRWIRRKLEADEDHLTKLVKVVIATMREDQQEIYEFTDGDRRKAATIMGAEVRTLNVHVSVVEQQHFKEQDINRCKAGLATIDPYFKQLNPAVRKIMLPFIIEILQQLGFKKAPELLTEFEGIPLTAEMGGSLERGPDGNPQLPQAEPPAASLQPAPSPPPVKGSLAVTAKIEQLPADVQAKLLGELGIQADPRELGDTPAPKAPEPHPDQLAADKANAAKKTKPATK